MTAARHLGPARDVVAFLHPAPRRPDDFFWKVGARCGDLDAARAAGLEIYGGDIVVEPSGRLTLIDLNDLWVHFDLREDLVKALKVGERFVVRIPALAERRITVEVRLIATKGEYASWRATRATGDFDLRTFSIRAYPVEKVPELRPGMSAYVDWQQRQ